jgi:NitT/TauT family transport system permease protein
VSLHHEMAGAAAPAALVEDLRLSLPAPGPGARWRGPVVRLVLAAVAVLGVWYLVPAVGLIEEIFLPPPHAVLDRLVQLVPTADLWDNARASMVVVLWGYAVAVAVGLTSGVLLGTVPFLGRALAPYLGALQALPKVVFAPLLITWLGVGDESRIGTAAIVGVLPIVVDTMVGLRAHGDQAARLMRVYAASPWKTFWLLRLPAALPLIFVGLRQGLLLSLAGALLAEVLIGSTEGLGHLVELYNGQIQMDSAFAVVAIVAALALIVSAGLSWVESKLIFWRGNEVT